MPPILDAGFHFISPDDGPSEHNTVTSQSRTSSRDATAPQRAYPRRDAVHGSREIISGETHAPHWVCFDNRVAVQSASSHLDLGSEHGSQRSLEPGASDQSTILMAATGCLLNALRYSQVSRNCIRVRNQFGAASRPKGLCRMPYQQRSSSSLNDFGSHC